jgi:predicted protein tyrosine phosphatase
MRRRLRILFVCAMNKERSVTAERLYRNDARLEVRSAGVRSDANRRVSQNDLEWADVVFTMESDHKRWILTRFESLELPPIEVLDIPDEYACMDPHLQEILKLTLDPEIDALLAAAEAKG